ncbi:MAG: CDP-alcohol phosphatidyltransferase family protein [Bdellovibrionales bacterium]|nr:CDP-alcohol phosphatidyltransferase family protein [Bdellovibrionales bacterium]
MPIFRSASPSPFVYIALPNLLTYVALAAGLAAIHAAASSDWHLAGACLGLCSLFDMFDGKFARLFKRTANHGKFGVELDSLCDVMTFGAAPVVTLRVLAFPVSDGAQWLWWAAASFYVLATVTRLGYFNVHQGLPGKSVFVGLPTTFVGILWSAAFLAPNFTQDQAPWILTGLGVAMLVPLEFNRPKGRAFLVLPISAASAILWNLVNR